MLNLRIRRGWLPRVLKQYVQSAERSRTPGAPFELTSGLSIPLEKVSPGSAGISHVASFDSFETGGKPPRLLVVQPRQHPAHILRAKLEEALRLAEALGAPRWVRHGDGGSPAACVPGGNPWVVVQQPRSGSGRRKEGRRIDAGAYFGKGTIEAVEAHIHAASSQGQTVDAVFVNTTLSGIQQRNLQAAWSKPVLDRVGLIIEIFGAHANTRAAKLQVAVAALEYRKSRLVRARGETGDRGSFGTAGEQQVVSAKARAGGGGRGFLAGAGESELQLQRRRIAAQQGRLREQLAEVRRTRALHREARQRRSMTGGGSGQGLPVVAVVGYTNAGKSSLVGALSKQPGLCVDDRLFATLDPRARGVVLPSGRKILLSDTVGFISDLPVQLLEAFQATLEEVLEADLLLHVIDSSAANAEQQRKTVLEVLGALGVSPTRLPSCTVEAWNKVDLVRTPAQIQGSTAEPATEMWEASGAISHEDSWVPAQDLEEEERRLDWSDTQTPASRTTDRTQNSETETPAETGGGEHTQRSGAGETNFHTFANDDVSASSPGVYSWAFRDKATHVFGSVDLAQVPRVATSAVDGSGLEELLQVIDDALMAQGR